MLHVTTLRYLKLINMVRYLKILLIVMVFGLAITPHVIAKEKAQVESVTYTLTPPPTCQNCVKKIKGNMRFEKGIKDISVDLTNKSVTITYSAKDTDKEKLKTALKKIGYTATEQNNPQK